MSKSNNRNTIGMLAEFENPAALLDAAEKVRDAGFKKFDCHSPFPIHGMDEAMGLKRSPLGWIVGIVAFFSFSGGMLLEWWTSSVEYPLVISGKPFFSYQAYGVVAWAIMVFAAAFVALIGMLALSNLPKFYHGLFHSNQFTKTTNDGFFVSIEADDPKFDESMTKKLLESIGGKNLEVLKEE